MVARISDASAGTLTNIGSPYSSHYVGVSHEIDGFKPTSTSSSWICYFPDVSTCTSFRNTPTFQLFLLNQLKCIWAPSAVSKFMVQIEGCDVRRAARVIGGHVLLQTEYLSSSYSPVCRGVCYVTYLTSGMECLNLTQLSKTAYTRPGPVLKESPASGNNSAGQSLR